jgi:hypothetical protein
MTRGVVIFAHDNNSISYTAMAEWNAKQITQHLGLPTTLITSESITSSAFDQIISSVPVDNGARWFDDLQASVPWRNTDRADAFELSPYDETLVLDADYIVSSSYLNTFFNVVKDIACSRYSFDVAGTDTFESLNVFGRYHMPMAWATVLFFKKTATSRAVFDMMKMIRQHWNHFRNLYAIDQTQFRNDYALAIALNTVYGHQAQWPTLPFKLATVLPAHKITRSGSVYRVDWTDKNNKKHYVCVQDLDLHIMGKHFLGDIIDNS